MAYMNSNAPGMGESTMEGQGGMGPGGGDEGHDQDSAYLPASVTGGQKFQVGDEIVLKVVGVDEESGDIEVAYAKGGGGATGKSGSQMIDEMEG